MMKYMIIGGVAGGATAAARLRRVDEKAEIVLLEKGKYISYANCGLPYYIGGVIAEREKLLVQTPESFGKRFRIDVRVENEAISIQPDKKKVTIRKADGSTYEESYDKLLLSPGATPVRPPLEGIDLEGIFTLRNVEDTDRIKSYISSKCVKRAVVVGAGFIGLEMAENLHHAGVHVSVVEMGNQVMAPIDFSMAAPVHQHLIQKGVALYLEEGVTRFERTDKGINVFLKSGKTIPADMVLLSIGVRPATDLAKQAGLRLGETGGIWVDEHLETSIKDIYAVGDAIEYPHPLTGKPWLNYLANPANRQGRIVADNMALGNVVAYEGAIGTSIAKVFDMTVASTGLAAKRLKQWGMDYCSSVTHSASHAGYYHASSMGYRAYLQGLTGYYNQIEFPDLNELQSAGEIVSIESATLYLYPLAHSYNEVSQLPEELRLYITDENNVLEDYVYGSDGVTVQTGNLTIDEMYGRETYYSFDMTQFIRNKFGTWGNKRQKLLMSLEEGEMATTFNQVVFTNAPDKDRQCRLDIRIKIYNEQ